MPKPGDICRRSSKASEMRITGIDNADFMAPRADDKARYTLSFEEVDTYSNFGIRNLRGHGIMLWEPGQSLEIRYKLSDVLKEL